MLGLKLNHVSKGATGERQLNLLCTSLWESRLHNAIIVYSTVYLGTDQRKRQSSTSLAFVGELTGERLIPRTIGQ